jgi:trimethylamine:corrinoid methyltransferase-like protein
MQKAGGKDMAQRANEQARKILNEHHPGVGHIAFERKD